MDAKSNHNPQYRNPNPILNPLRNKSGGNKENHKRAMEKFKEAVIKFAESNPSLFRNDGSNSYQRLIEQRLSQFFPDFHTPNHPPYAAMIHRAIWELNEKGGSSEESISKYIKQEYDDLPWAHSTLLKHHLEKLCDYKEICMTHKQCYFLAGADSDPISSSRTDEHQLKRKHNSELGKKSSRHYKKRKKLRWQNPVSGKKKEERQFDVQETNKQIIEVFQEQDQVLRLLNEVADEQQNLTCNDLHEAQYLMIEDGLINIVGANATEKAYMTTNSDVMEAQKDICETKKRQLRRKRRLKSKRRSSKCTKKHEVNEETQLQVLNEAPLKQHNEVADSESHEQNQMIEDNMVDIQIQQNQLERRQNDVTEWVGKDGETAQDAPPDNLCRIKIKIKKNPQLLQQEESPDSNLVLLKRQYLGGRVLTRSQLKTMSKKDASASSELMESRGYASMPKDKCDVEYLSEEKQQAIEVIGPKEAKRVPSAISAYMNGQRAKLRSWRNTGHAETVIECVDTPVLQMEPQQTPRSPSLERPLKELLSPLCKKLRPRFPDLVEPVTAPSSAEAQEAGSSQHQQPDELKYRRRCRHPQLKTFQKDKISRNSKPADISQQGLHSYAEEDKPKHKGHGMHLKPKEAKKDAVLSDSKLIDILKAGRISAKRSTRKKDQVT